MPLHRVTIDLAFPTEAHAQGLYNHALGLLQHAVNINPDALRQELGYICWHLCGHAESPPQPCQLIAKDDIPIPPPTNPPPP